MNRILSLPRSVSPAVVETGRRSIERHVRQTVPALADFCFVHLVVGRSLRCVAAAHGRRAGARDVGTLVTTHRIRLDDRVSTVAHVVRTGRVLLRAAIPQEPDGDAGAGRVADLHRRLAPTSVLVAPISRLGAVVGAVSLCYSHSERAYRPRDIAAARRLAASIADALLPPDPLRPVSPARRPGNGSSIRSRAATRS